MDNGEGLFILLFLVCLSVATLAALGHLIWNHDGVLFLALLGCWASIYELGKRNI